MEQHFYISRRLKTLAPALEGTLGLCVKWELDESGNRSRRYKLAHQVSPSETWNCGEVLLAPLEVVPDVLKPLFGGTPRTEEILAEWTDLTLLLPDSASPDERNHLALTIGRFLDLFAGMAMMRSTGDPIVPLSSPSLETLLTTVSAGPGPGTGLQVASYVLEIPVPARPLKPHRPQLDKEEIAKRSRIVRRAEKIRKETGKGWKQIAAELGVPERTLRDWRHNPTYR